MKKLLVLILLVLVLIACGEEKKTKVNSSLKKGPISDQESWNSEIRFTDLGNLKAVLFADHMMKYDDKKETLLDNVKIDFYDEFGVKTSTLTSKKGRVDDRTKDMYAIDSVVSVNNEGVKLTTDELMWRNRDSKIITDRFVRITTPNEIIEGYGFESDQNLKNYEIFEPVINSEIKEEQK